MVVPRPSCGVSDVTQGYAKIVSGGSRGVNVLIIEDDEAVAAVVQAWLRVDSRFLRVDQVGSVAAARAWIVDEAPDIVVLDHALPDGTAAHVLDALREGGRRASVVLYTSHADFADLGRALGCDAAVHKGDWAGLADQLLNLAAAGSR